MRILLYSLAGIFLLLGVLYALALSPRVQTSLVKFITGEIERTTGVRVQVGGVDFRPIRSLVLNDVLVRDFKNDTLLYCKDLQVRADSFSLARRTFTVREVVLTGAEFNLWSQDSTNKTNVEMLLDSLAGRGARRMERYGDGGQGTERVEGVEGVVETVERGRPAGNPWLFGLRKVSLRDSRFTYREEVYKAVDYGVNWTDVDCRELNVDVTELDFMGNPVRMRVSDLSFVEKSGLRMRKMEGVMCAKADELVVTDCRIGLERSDVDLIRLEYHWTPNRRDWKYFTTRMQQYYELGPSAVSFIDLAYFNGILRGIDNTVKFSGVVTNTIDQLEGRDLYFELGEGSIFQGSFKSLGLPDIENTFFNIRLEQAHFLPGDLASVYLPWFGMNIPVPSFLYRLPSVDFRELRFDGTLSDFIVQAESITPDLQGDLSFIYGLCGQDTVGCVDMRGDFRFDRVDFGLLAGIPGVKRGGLSGSYEGWLREGTPFRMQSRVHRLGVHKGYLRQADVALVWEGGKLDVMASVEDEKLQGGAVVSYDLRDSLEFSSVRGNLRVADLDAFGFGLAADSGEGKEQCEIAFDRVAASRDGREFARLTLRDMKYAGASGSFTIDELSVEDTKGDGYNTTVLQSDILDMTLEGNYKEVKPLLFMKELVENYLPAYTVGKGRRERLGRQYLERFDFAFRMRMKQVNRVLSVLYPSLRVAEGAELAGYFSSESESLSLTFVADTVGVQRVDLLDTRMVAEGNAQRLGITATSRHARYGTDYRLGNLRNELILEDNHIDNRITWSNWGEKTYSGALSAGVTFLPAGRNGYTAEITLQPGVVVMDDSVWRVNPSTIRVEGKEIAVEDFSIRRGRGGLAVKGKISEDGEEKLTMDLWDFNLRHLARVVSAGEQTLFGVTSGTLTLQDCYRDFLLLADFKVEDWGINRDTLGTLEMRSYWDKEGQRLVMGAENRLDGKVSLGINGTYRPAMDSLGVHMRMEKLGVERFGAYMANAVSDVRGKLSGNLFVGGTVEKPEISGIVVMDSVGVRVNALNARFDVDDTIRMDRNRLALEDFVLRDEGGNRAVLNGEYRVLENRYRVRAAFDRLRVLNTGAADNELFYGQMSLSGLAELDNADGLMNISVNARTEGDSRLYVPLTASNTEQTHHFLHFLHTDAAIAYTKELQGGETDIRLEANLEVDDQLEVQVIFDPTVGDVLKATGNGNIKVGFDKDGSLSMFGEYKVEKGDYLFTLSNLVNKKFVLTPGGTITWSGSPYEAMLDINAVYNLKTTISELLPTDGGEAGGEDYVSESGRKVPVECILNLSDNLSNPVVRFDIDFPTLESQSKGYIQSLFSSQDEINKQMFSLLVLNRFYRTDNAGDYRSQAQSVGVTTVTEMMSNQLSNWLSQISSNVDIGVAYRMGDPNHEVSSDEIEVALSTQLLDDRITISANGNMDVGNTRNAPADRKTNIAGDFDIEVKLNKQGSLKMKAYSHTNEKVLYNNTEMIQGVGVSYQESFDTFRELWRKYFTRRKKKRGDR